MIKSDWIKKVLLYLNLEKDVDDINTIHKTIEKNIQFQGANLWILVFAIFIASVGLNVNSTAVIIGAMLISPLMGPINGMGYSIATYDLSLFRKSVKNFSFAVVASLITSTLYFSISPISTAQSELLARTTPTIYDVLIALFGGLAGIVALSTKQKGNVIPGVAIATALMPPLCTAGYGLATGQMDYFFGAFYLFTINSVFIALSSVIICQMLEFPIRSVVGDLQKRKINRWISAVIIIIVIPSIYFGYQLVQEEKFMTQATTYVRNISVVEGNYLLKNEIRPKEKSILLVYGGPSLNELQKKNISEKASDFGLTDADIQFNQGLSLDEVTRKSSEVENLKVEINQLKMLLQEKEQKNDSVIKRNFIGRQILNEIRSIYPQIISCSYSTSYTFRDTVPDPVNMDIVVFSTNKKNISNTEKNRIQDWLKARLHTNRIKVIYEL